MPGCMSVWVYSVERGEISLNSGTLARQIDMQFKWRERGLILLQACQIFRWLYGVTNKLHCKRTTDENHTLAAAANWGFTCRFWASNSHSFNVSAAHSLLSNNPSSANGNPRKPYNHRGQAMARAFVQHSSVGCCRFCRPSSVRHSTYFS